MATLSQTKTRAQEATEASETPQPVRAGCCGGPAPQGSGACCSLDAEVKLAGGTGCGCEPAPAAAKRSCC